MLKMSYDPILGARYISDDTEPRAESQRVVYADVHEQLNRARNIKAKQIRHIKNTKQK